MIQVRNVTLFIECYILANFVSSVYRLLYTKYRKGILWEIHNFFNSVFSLHFTVRKNTSYLPRICIFLVKLK